MKKTHFYKKYASLPKEVICFFYTKLPVLAVARYKSGELLPCSPLNLNDFQAQIESLKEGLSGDFFTIGSAPEADHVLELEGIPPILAVVEKIKTGYVIYDCSNEYQHHLAIVVN